MYPNTRNIVLPAGRAYFNELRADGTYVGELYLAETPGFALKVASESTVIMSDDGPVAEELVNKTTSVSRDFDLKCKNMTGDVLAMFLIADKASLTTTAGPVTGKAINGGAGVTQGYWYQLGEDASFPAGVRNVSAVSIKTGATTHVLDADYKLDATGARIYIMPGGGIADDTVITSDYTKAATSWENITSNDLGAKTGAFRFVADNTSGENRDLYVRSCVMSPNGSIEFKGRTTPQEAGFSVKVQKPTDGTPSVIVNGRAV